MRLHILFNGSPDVPEEQTFVGVADENNKMLLQRQVSFARWRSVNKKVGLWALEVDVLPLSHPTIIYVIGLEEDQGAMDDVRSTLVRQNTVVLTQDTPTSEDDEQTTQRLEALHLAKVDLADRIFLASRLTSDPWIDAAHNLAVSTSKAVSHMYYD